MFLYCFVWLRFVNLYQSQGRGQNIVFGAIAPSHGERGSESLLWGSGAYAPCGPYAKLLVRRLGRRSPTEAESYLKIKWAILRSGFDYLTVWCFQIFSLLLIACYIYMPLKQKHIYWAVKWIYWSCFGNWIIHVWGLFVVFWGLSTTMLPFPRPD